MSGCEGSTGAELAICQFASQYPNLAQAVAKCESNQGANPSIASACDALQTQLGSQLLTANVASATDAPAARTTGNRSGGPSAEAEPTGQSPSRGSNGDDEGSTGLGGAAGRASRTRGSPTMSTATSTSAGVQGAMQTGTAAAAAALQSSKAASDDHYRTHVVIPAAVVGSVVGVLLIALILFFLLRRRRKSRQADQEKPAMEDYSRIGGVGSPAPSPMNAGATFATVGAGAAPGAAVPAAAAATRSSDSSSIQSSLNEKHQSAAYGRPSNHRFVTSMEEPSQTPQARNSVGSGSWFAAGGLDPRSRQRSEWEREQQPERPATAMSDASSDAIPTAGGRSGDHDPFATPMEAPGGSLTSDGYGSHTSRDADEAASSYRAAMGRSSGSSRRPHEADPPGLDERVMGSYRSGTPQQQQNSAQVSSTPSRASSASKNTELLSPPRKSSKRIPARGTNPLRSAGISGFDFGFGRRREERGEYNARE